jgi:Domain of unknown function (DUF2828)
MTTFVQASQNTVELARGANGMKAQASTLNKVVDLFFSIGASRGKDITANFETAYQQDSELALRVALWARDAREGAGERELFRNVLRHLEKRHADAAMRVIPRVAELGRWDDLLVFTDSALQKAAFAQIKAGLDASNGLCAKWMPRKGAVAEQLRAYLGFTPKQYRKTLVNLTKVVESQMCAKDWNSIKFSHVPSLAMSRYNKAFGKNAPDAFNAYKAALAAGTAKVNAAAVYPYDVIKTLRFGGDAKVANAQWDALPNYVGDASILPVVDVSGSMSCPAGGNPNLTCMDVSLSLGLYLADKNKGPFKDAFVTFSTKPKIQVLKGNLAQKLDQLSRAEWGMSTDLNAVFDRILEVATAHKLPQAELPQTVLILSDMNFNQCVANDDSAHQMIVRKYASAGYTVPNVVFWNLNDNGTKPVSFDKQGTALVSGFSPSIMSSILGAKTLTPEAVMLDTIMKDRYAV